MGKLFEIRQPWLFILLAVGFGVVAYLASGENLIRAIVGGVAFAALISLWRELRKRLGRRQAVRTLGRRFRQDPSGYLKTLENSIIN